MPDSFEWLAIALGALAAAIALWDDVRDRYYAWVGPVRPRLVAFDVPRPGAVRPGTDIRMSWRCWNKLSWGILVSFPVEYRMDAPGGPTTPQIGVKVRDELLQECGTSFIAPPKQPVERTVWVTWPNGVDGTITPLASVFFGKRPTSTRGPTMRVQWVDGHLTLARTDGADSPTLDLARS